MSIFRLLIFAFFTDYVMLIIAQIMGGMGEGAGAGQPSVSGLIADKTTKESRVKVFTIIALVSSLMDILGYLFGSLPKHLQPLLLIEEVESFRLIFLICAFLSFFSFIFILPIREEKPEISREAERSFLPRKSVAIISRYSFVRAIGGFGFGITGDLIGPWFKIRFLMGEEVLGPIFAISRFTSTILYFLIFRVKGEIDEVKMIFFNRIISAAAMLLIPFTPSYIVFSLLFAIYRASLLITVPIRQSFIVSIVDPSERASAVGFSNFAWMSLRSLSPAIGGYIMQNISMPLAFIIGATMTGLNGASYHLMLGGKRTERS